MNPPTNRTAPQDIVGIEETVLAGICRRDAPSADIAQAIEQLRDYEWLDPEHATVFAAVRSVAMRLGGEWRDILPAQATRMGFPDVDWPRYFKTKVKTAPALGELVASLTKAAKR